MIFDLRPTDTAVKAVLDTFSLSMWFLVYYDLSVIVIVSRGAVEEHPCAGEARMGASYDNYFLHILLSNLLHCFLVSLWSQYPVTRQSFLLA
jgi:hypothetical protein